MSFLKLTDVTKFYGSTCAVQAMNLTVQKGEFVSLLGPSGCGKTTTLQMVAGFEAVTSGRIELDGKDITHAKANTRGLGIVFQSYALFPHMTVAANVSFGLEMRKVPKAERAERVAQALALVHLEKHATRYPRELSGGQRQRVALARALVIEPPVLLLDEPLSNLDAKLRAQTRLEIQKLHRELGITSLFVTHDQVEAMTLAQRMIVMNAGNMEQFGTPEEVYHTPASTFVASFIGSPPMNLLKHAPNSKPGTILGIRPEHMDIGSEGWEVRVDTIELLGAERLVYASMGEDSMIVRIDEGRPSPKPGDTIRVAPREDRLHWFNAETGKRL